MNRIQLTLFIGGDFCSKIEAIRRKFNPEQYALIGAHVTLCREDELGTTETVMKQMAELKAGCITVLFGPPERFSDGKGVLMPAIGENRPFQDLRKIILGGEPRRHEPHITLMHPRNSTCTDDIFAQIIATDLPHQITFRKVSLIKQEDGGVWKVLKAIELVPIF